MGSDFSWTSCIKVESITRRKKLIEHGGSVPLKQQNCDMRYLHLFSSQPESFQRRGAEYTNSKEMTRDSVKVLDHFDVLWK